MAQVEVISFENLTEMTSSSSTNKVTTQTESSEIAPGIDPSLIQTDSDKEIYIKMKNFIQNNPFERDIFVFAYGSLMWNPGFKYEIRFPSKLIGFRRELCILSTIYRGNPENPGLVFGLDLGGNCEGLVYKLWDENYLNELFKIFKREMISDAYIPKFVKIVEPFEIRALTFVVNEDSDHYSWPLPDHKKAELVKSGQGSGGTSLEYLQNTQTFLKSIDISDPDLDYMMEKIMGNYVPIDPTSDLGIEEKDLEPDVHII